MRTPPWSLIVLAALVLSALGQTNPPPRTALPAVTTSPEIHADRRVTFRVKAGQANDVTVGGQGISGKVALTRGENGEWSTTVGPMEPGVYEYSFTLDGVQMIDPSNAAIKPQRQPRTSILHIPGDPPLVWDFQDVPHGVVHQHGYQSKTLGALRQFYVFTPPGYEKNATTKYPVLYLIHGFGDNHATWTQHGKAHWILDNLIALKKARPMVVVMPDGHPVAPGSGPRDQYGIRNSQALEKEIMEEMLPIVESAYRVKADASSRAIAGLSMGGGHSLHTGFSHLDQFAWIGAFSAGVPGQDRMGEMFSNPEAANQHLKLLWIACGKSDFLIERNRQLVALLTEKGIHHTWIETEGDHSWPVWRRYLADFAPLLFTETK
ncbi:MAG TPA: alpha/beta hydrolase-fold protein [Chthoniobacteraceae bacterium]|nr:alpha/beta hydrolase-fold protein [Chthoniobacteraceae bacterium]